MARSFVKPFVVVGSHFQTGPLNPFGVPNHDNTVECSTASVNPSNVCKVESEVRVPRLEVGYCSGICFNIPIGASQTLMLLGSHKIISDALCIMIQYGRIELDGRT